LAKEAACNCESTLSTDPSEFIAFSITCVTDCTVAARDQCRLLNKTEIDPVYWVFETRLGQHNSMWTSLLRRFLQKHKGKLREKWLMGSWWQESQTPGCRKHPAIGLE
jgi:hypothetical protein